MIKRSPHISGTKGDSLALFFLSFSRLGQECGEGVVFICSVHSVGRSFSTSLIHCSSEFTLHSFQVVHASPRVNTLSPYISFA